MNNKIIGLVLSLISGFVAVAFAIIVDGASGGVGNFLSLPTFVFVVGVGYGFTYMRTDLLKGNEIVKAYRSNFILAGWLGFIVGIILMGAGSDSISDMPAIGFSAATVSVLYGYVIGVIAETFLNK